MLEGHRLLNPCGVSRAILQTLLQTLLAMPRPLAGGPPAVCCQLSHLRKRRIGLVEVAPCLTAARALPYSTSARAPHRAEMP